MSFGTNFGGPLKGSIGDIGFRVSEFRVEGVRVAAGGMRLKVQGLGLRVSGFVA